MFEGSISIFRLKSKRKEVVMSHIVEVVELQALLKVRQSLSV